MNDDDVFLRNFLAGKKELEDSLPIDAFVMVIKFDLERGEGFFLAARQFIQLFGTLSIKSLTILCRQGNASMNYSNDEFDAILKKDLGYKLLKAQNGEQDIPYCLWDNVQPYDGQHEAFLQCLKNLRKVGKTEMSFIFDIVQNALNNRNEVIRLRDENHKLNNQPRNRFFGIFNK